jgi:hypothetical protein
VVITNDLFDFFLGNSNNRKSGLVTRFVKANDGIDIEKRNRSLNMRPTLIALVVFASSLFGGASATYAAPDAVPALKTPDDDDKKKKELSIEEMKKKAEATFAQMLVWDEKTKKFKIKKEFTKSLPVPAPFIENFLNGFLKSDNGRPIIGDEQRFKQMLPMLRRFMKQGGKDLENLGKMTPKERQKALKKIQGYGKMLGNPKARDGMKKLGKILTPKNKSQPKRVQPKRAQPKARPRLRESLEQRIERLEGHVKRLEQALRQRFDSQGDSRKGGLQKKAPKRLALPKLSLPKLGGLDAAKDVVKGLVKLSQLMEKEDWERVVKVVQTIAGEFKPDDLQDQGKLLQKLQKVMDPSDLERFMEIISDFLETEEGQAFESRVEKLVSDLETFMSSDRGQKLMENVRKLSERLQGSGSGLQKNIEKLFGGKRGSKKKAQPKKSRRKSRELVSRLY